jgi:endonuclease/exonuclease/phosphatase family metal-dependent hydrolase
MTLSGSFSVGSRATGSRISLLIIAGLLAATFLAASGVVPQDAQSAPKAKKKPTSVVKVMTRNVYLGASLTEAINAPTSEAFFEANGEILRSVDTNDFRVRAKGLAREIRSKGPDLVGLQEVARWATGPPDLSVITNPAASTAKTVRYDFLELLMTELNRGKKRYRVVKVTTEFDFEAPANYQQAYTDINGRLTMRDVIIAKVGKQVRTRKARGANFSTLYRPVISGITVTVTRGWNSVEAKVGKGPWFKFVNTHLEAFGDERNEVVDCMTEPAPAYAGNQVSIRCSQARELFRRAIAPGRLPVVAVGDFNSDDDSVLDVNCPNGSNPIGSAPPFNGGLCGDTFAYNALKKLGMRNVSTSKPMSCCVRSDILTADRGSRADFDHHIDHILTDSPRKVRRLASSVTGLKPENGFWNSDHAGVFSKLRVRG